MRLRHALLGVSLLFAPAGACAPKPAAVPSASTPTQLLPARLRRLSNAEYEQTVQDLLGVGTGVAALLPPDARQDGYTPNAAQGAPAAWASRLDAVARKLARTGVEQRLATLAPCAARASAADRVCAAELIDGLGPRAFRRPLAPEERNALFAVYDAGARGSGSFAGGAELVLRELLTSPSLLYLDELGLGGAPSSVVELTPYQIASALSYTVRGGPPDEELLNAAASGELGAADAREHHARRLLGQSDTRHQFRRFVLEWLEVDGLEETAKSAELHPGYDALRSRFLAETRAFTDEILVHGGASVRALLGAGFASVDPPLARYYGLATYGARASLAGSGRIGILQQASFLAAHAHEDATSPAKRGDFVMKKLLCAPVRRPSELGIDLVIPAPSKAKTTRERFAAHVVDPACGSCHETLDALGYAFENFDAAGGARKSENGKPVDTSSRVRLLGEDRVFADSLGLSSFLADRPEVSECFARQAFRYWSGQADPAVEAGYVALRAGLEQERAGNLVEELSHFVRSDLFVRRRVVSP